MPIRWFPRRCVLRRHSINTAKQVRAVRHALLKSFYQKIRTLVSASTC